MKRWCAVATSMGGAIALGASGSGGPSALVLASTAAADVEVPDGFEVSELVSGLSGPTQLQVLDDGRFVIAQLNGGEDDGTGQILVLDPDDDGEADVLYDDLTKPTGVAVIDGEVWVMEQRRLSVGTLEGDPLDVVLDELPFNGRSEGSLTVDPDGRLLYDTSGTLDGTGAAPGSATLWALTPGDDEPEVLATGFKHAYAHTFDDDATLWVTEISDGSYDGEPAPDELVAVEPGDDFGWPQCVGDRQPVDFYGGTPERCDETPRSHALFAAGATPTSVAVAPWDRETLLVSLWVDGEVVAVPINGDEPVESTPFVTGIEHPQFVIADGDRLLVVDFDGRILSVEAT